MALTRTPHLFLPLLALPIIALAQSKPMTMELSVVATAGNSIVEDLAAGDLTIKDNGKKQDIVSFTKVTGGAPAGQPGISHIVLLDALNTTYMDTPRARRELLKALAALSKQEQVTLLMIRDKPRVVSDPGAADDGPALLRRLAKQGVKELEGDSPDLAPYSWVFTDPSALADVFTPSGVFDRQRMAQSINILQVIARNYQGRPGRKNLYWIGANFPLVMGQTSLGYNETTLGAPAPTKGTVPQGTTVGNKNDDLTMFAKDLELTARFLLNAGVSIYPIDSRALTLDTAEVSDKDRMSDIARETGGISYASRTDVGAAMAEAIADSRTTYSVKYAITDLKPDGKFHQVRIETKRGNIKLRTRSGFYAPLPNK
jgi:VWFA-related protein